MGSAGTSEHRCVDRSCNQVRLDMTPVVREPAVEVTASAATVITNAPVSTPLEPASVCRDVSLPGSEAHVCDQVAPPSAVQHGTSYSPRVGAPPPGLGRRESRKLDSLGNQAADPGDQRGKPLHGHRGSEQDGTGDPDGAAQQEQSQEEYPTRVLGEGVAHRGVRHGHSGGHAAQGHQQDPPGVPGPRLRCDGIWEVLPAQSPGDLPEGPGLLPLGTRYQGGGPVQHSPGAVRPLVGEDRGRGRPQGDDDRDEQDDDTEYGIQQQWATRSHSRSTRRIATQDDGSPAGPTRGSGSVADRAAPQGDLECREVDGVQGAGPADVVGGDRSQFLTANAAAALEHKS